MKNSLPKRHTKSSMKELSLRKGSTLFGFCRNIICILLLIRTINCSTEYIQIPDYDLLYIMDFLKFEHNFGFDDALLSIFELENYYNGLKNNLFPIDCYQPSSNSHFILKAWHAHILHTTKYFNFTYTNFNRYIHTDPDYGKRKNCNIIILSKLMEFDAKKSDNDGRHNINETIWLYHENELIYEENKHKYQYKLY